MKGFDEWLLSIMKRADFTVPVFQRNYDWKIAQCERLFDDLEEVLEGNRTNHFFGSVVSTSGDRFDSRQLIDGQQRITTVYLLLTAIARALEVSDAAGDKFYAKQITYDYLVASTPQGSSRPKLRLKLIKDDDEALGRIAMGDDDVPQSNVAENFAYLSNRLAVSRFSPSEILGACQRLQIINIELESSDNPQLVFESLNSTGLDLSEGDKIRNYVLMPIPASEQDLWYENYWNRIEKNTSFDVSSFARCFLTLRQGKVPNKKGVYEEFKRYSKDLDMRKVIGDMRDMSDRWREITCAVTGNQAIDQALSRLNLLGYDAAMPYLLALLDARHDGVVGDDEVAGAIALIDSFLFRRWVCGVASNGLNKVFVTLHADALRIMAKVEGVSYDRALSHVLLSRSGSSRAVGDEEFASVVKTRDFYKIKKNYRRYLFDRLENGDSAERVDVIGGLDANPPLLSIEHIMPQTLTPAWREDLGPNADDIHDEWINRVANLTLTGYNSKYSNFAFARKRDMELGFSDSHIHMNAWISSQPFWGIEQLRERNELLAKQFLELWPAPIDTVDLPQRQIEYTLQDMETLRGEKPNAWTLWGDRHLADSWRDLYVSVIQALYDSDPEALYRAVLMLRQEGDHRFPVERTKKTDVRIVDGIWADVNQSVESMGRGLVRLFDHLEHDPSDLQIELVNLGAMTSDAATAQAELPMS